jgi:hypothetical protein
MSVLKENFEFTATEFSDKPNDPAHYNETLKKLCTVKTSEELGYVLSHISPFVNSVPFNINVFKNGVSASWEDEANLQGCSWTVQCKPELANAIFERLSIFLTLHGFSKFECNGISANIRKNFVKFSVWSKNVPSVVNGAEVLEELKDAFGFDLPVEFLYKNHKNLLEKISTFGSSTKNE